MLQRVQRPIRRSVSFPAYQGISIPFRGILYIWIHDFMCIICFNRVFCFLLLPSRLWRTIMATGSSSKRNQVWTFIGRETGSRRLQTRPLAGLTAPNVHQIVRWGGGTFEKEYLNSELQKAFQVLLIWRRKYARGV